VASYAKGKKAFGFCDRCGFRYDLRDLKSETVNLVSTNLLVCEECWDPDHPQNMLGRIRYDDPQALRNQDHLAQSAAEIFPLPIGGTSRTQQSLLYRLEFTKGVALLMAGSEPNLLYQPKQALSLLGLMVTIG